METSDCPVALEPGFFAGRGTMNGIVSSPVRAGAASLPW
jgi:hypothetical protein